MDTVSQIKDRLSIVDVVGQYVKLQKAGVNYKGKCPFHSERTASFFVSPERGTYHCFGCNVGGDMFTFVQEMDGVDFKGALAILGERAGVRVVFKKGDKKDANAPLYDLLEASTAYFEGQLDGNAGVINYLASRGVDGKTIRNFRIGWAPDEWHGLEKHLTSLSFSFDEMEKVGVVKRNEKGVYDRFRSRIMFPINDSAGRTIGFSGRFLSQSSVAADDNDTPKYINSPESALYSKSRSLYGFDKAKLSIRKNNFAVLVEGQMDLVLSHKAGFTNTVAVSGTALTADHQTLIERLSGNLVLALDADEAGLRAAIRSAHGALLRGMDVKVARLPEGKDPADIISEGGGDAWRAVVRNSKHVVLFLVEILRERAKDERAFVRSVERDVIPLLSSIKSPIDVEHFVKEVSVLAGISEDAIRKSMDVALTASAPASGSGRFKQEEIGMKEKEPRPLSRREMLYAAILVMRRREPAKASHAMDAVMQAVGKEEYEKLESASKEEKERLVFAAENVYANGISDKDIEFAAREVRRERLQNELSGASNRVRAAEASGDEKEAMEALRLCTMLTAEIAKLDEAR